MHAENLKFNEPSPLSFNRSHLRSDPEPVRLKSRSGWSPKHSGGRCQQTAAKVCGRGPTEGKGFKGILLAQYTVTHLLCAKITTYVLTRPISLHNLLGREPDNKAFIMTHTSQIAPLCVLHLWMIRCERESDHTGGYAVCYWR